MPEQIRTIELPFDKGIDQKNDPYWNAQPQILTNVIKQKRQNLSKRPGLSALATVGGIQATSGSIAATMTLGRRLLTFAGNPVIIATDRWTDAIWNWNESTATPILMDRVPEVYLTPYQGVGNAQPNLFTSNIISTFFECDAAVTNGYECVVWGDQNEIGIWVTIRQLATGAVVQRPVLLKTAAVGNPTFYGKVVAIGNSFLVTAAVSFGGTIGGVSIDTTNLAAGFTAPAVLNTLAGDAISNFGVSFADPYDVCPVIGDATKFGLLYEATRGGVRTIRIVIYTLAGFVVVSDTAIDSVDATWTADNAISAVASQLTACALRVDSVNSEAAYAYAWRSTVPLMRVSTGIRNYTAMTNKATPVNLMGTIMPAMSTTDKAPAIVTIERNGGAVNPANYMIRMSPGSSVFDKGSAQLPYIASWQAANGAGTMTIAANQPRWTAGLSLWSRDYLANGISYLVGLVPSTTQGSFFLMADDFWNDVSTVGSNFNGSWCPLRLVGNIAPRLASPLVPTVAAPLQSGVAAHLSAAPSLPNVGSAALIPFLLATTTHSVQPAHVFADFANAKTHQAGELGTNAIIASASPSGFDGAQSFELAFPAYPVIAGVSLAGAAGALSAGSYAWIAIYEWTDHTGQVHRSARSVPFVATALANQTATLTITTMGYSAKVKANNAAITSNASLNPQAGMPGSVYPHVGIKVYRTQVGGTVFNQLSSSDQPSSGNFVTGLTTTVGDAAADTAIVGNALLYGDGSDGTAPGNILDNLCAPAFQAVLVHQNRIFGVDGPRIWPSKALTSGEGSGFNEATAFSVDDGPGPVVALASLDDKLILFKGDRLFYMTGLGPADNGTGNDFTPPQRIASDVGAIDWRGVLSTPQGVYFMSPAGRRLLTRDLQVVPVPVIEDFDTTYPKTTGAVLHPTGGRMIFTQTTNDTATPRVGVFPLHDYVSESCWTIGQFNDGVGNVAHGFVSAVVASAQVSAGPPAVVQPTLHLLRADGTVMRESTTSFLDLPTLGGATVFYSGRWTSQWLKSDGLQGWSTWRLLRLTLKPVDPAALLIAVSYDYKPAGVQVVNVTAAQVAAATSQGLYLIEIRPAQPRAAALQVTIADTTDATTVTGAGFLLEGCRVDYDYEPGGYRAPAGQRA